MDTFPKIPMRNLNAIDEYLHGLAFSIDHSGHMSPCTKHDQVFGRPEEYIIQAIRC